VDQSPHQRGLISVSERPWASPIPIPVDAGAVQVVEGSLHLQAPAAHRSVSKHAGSRPVAGRVAGCWRREALTRFPCCPPRHEAAPLRELSHHLGQLGVSFSAGFQGRLNGTAAFMAGAPRPPARPRWATAYSRKRLAAVWWKGCRALRTRTGRRSLCRTAARPAPRESAQASNRCRGCLARFHSSMRHGCCGDERIHRQGSAGGPACSSASTAWDSLCQAAADAMPRDCADCWRSLNFRPPQAGMIGTVPDRLPLCPPFRTLDHGSPRRPQRQHRARHRVKRTCARALAGGLDGKPASAR